jgi:hypothetical protein
MIVIAVVYTLRLILGGPTRKTNKINNLTHYYCNLLSFPLEPWDWSPQLWIAARVDDIFRSELIPIPDDYGGSPYDPGEWEYNGLKDRLKELAEIVTNNHRLNGVASFDNVVDFTS